MTELTHKDMLGRECRVDDTIAFSQYNVLYIGKITKVTPKRVHCSAYRKDGLAWWGSHQLPETFLKVEDPQVLAWILKGARTKATIMYEDNA